MQLDEVKLTDIKFGNRFREDLGDVEGLAESIRTKGIISPLAVSYNREGEGQEPYMLLAGGRRYTAAHLAGIETVPVRIYDKQLTDLELRSIELEENIQRKDLDWIEKCNLQREIHQLQLQIHGTKHSTAPDATGWSMRDTAKLLGTSLGGVSMDVKLANAVHELPDLDWKQCRNKSEAMKLLNRLEEKAITSELAKRAELQAKSGAKSQNQLEAFRQRLIDAYQVKDFLVAAKRLESKLFNFVEIDPPYAIDLGNMKKKDGLSNYDWSPDGYNEHDQATYMDWMVEVLGECYRLMADNSWLVLWFAPEPWFEKMYTALNHVGFKTTRLCGMWVKPSGQTMNPGIRLASAYEPFFWARKGEPALARQGALNVFPFSQVAANKKTHPTERPIELMSTIISTFAFPNSRVLVPFAGSGSTLLAAGQLGMHPLGFDLSSQFKESYTLRVVEMFR